MLDHSEYIKSGDATNVVIVQTSTVFGTSKLNGDVNIIVKYKPIWKIGDNHSVACAILAGTATKENIMKAQRDGKGVFIVMNDGDDYETLSKVREDEFLVGAYSTFDKHKRGTFMLEIPPDKFELKKEKNKSNVSKSGSLTTNFSKNPKIDEKSLDFDVQ